MSGCEELIACIEGATGRQGRKVGQNTRLLCPAHDDHDPSLDVAEGDQGQPLVVCRSRGCSYEQVCASIGREPGDFLPSTTAEWTPFGDAIAVYHYVDETGALLYDVCRTGDKQFPQRRPDPTAKSGWRWKLDDTRRVLYRLDRVAAAAADGFPEPIYVAEGEKDVHALERAGALATCNSGGAGKWTTDHSRELLGARVLIVADLDEAGVAHAQQVAASLAAAANGDALAIEILQPAQGKDAAEHFAAGLGLTELVPLQPKRFPVETVSVSIVFETLREFRERKLPAAESLVGTARNGTNLLPRFGWLLPWGREGSGKTSVLLDLIFHAAAGRNWQHYPVTRPVRIVIVINEGVPGGLQDKINQKLELWDGPTDQLQDQLAIYASPWGEFSFKNEQMAAHLRDYTQGFQADYVALDPLHTMGTTGAGTPQETEDFKHLLRKHGLWQDIGYITAHHSNKGGMVSGDWARHADTVLRLEKDGKRPATKLTLEKARPADPHEIGVPQLLEWNTDTMGYTLIRVEQHERVADSELLDRIYTALAAASKPLRMSELQEAVAGDTKRVSALAKSEVEQGRIANSSTTKSAYALELPETRDQQPLPQ